MAYFRTEDGTKIPYNEKGIGKPLVCLPGWTMPKSMFDRQLNGLSGRYNVIALEQRGQGDSDKDHVEGISHEVWARDLNEFLLQRDLRDVILIGWSLGLWEAWSYFEQFKGERITALIAIEMVAELGEPGWADEENESMKQDPENYQRSFIDGMFTSTREEEKKLLLQEVLKTPLKVAQALQSVQEQANLSSALPTVNVPTLLIFGKESPFFTDEQRKFVVDQIPQARLMVFDHSAHCPFWDEAEKFNAVVTEFIEEQRLLRSAGSTKESNSDSNSNSGAGSDTGKSLI